MSTVFLKNTPPISSLNISPHSNQLSSKVFCPSYPGLRFGQIICQTLIKIHEKGLIFGNLHPNCVLIDH